MKAYILFLTCFLLFVQVSTWLARIKNVAQYDRLFYSTNYKSFASYTLQRHENVIKYKNANIRRKIIIDTDAGADDAPAILLALKIAEIDVIAITCTYGNTEETNVETNVLKILTIANMSHIPVYGGAKRPLLTNWEAHQFFGKDGLGDFKFTKNITAKVDKSTIAAVALVNLVNEYPGKITVITLGPLTNLALAARLDPTFIQNVDEIFSMGITISGKGSIRPNVDFNFGTDPESSFIFLNSTTKPITLITREAANIHKITLEWRKNVFGKLNSKAVNFLNKAERISKRKKECWSSPDLKTVGIAIWPFLIKESFTVNVTPVFDGAAKGSVLVDYNNSTGKLHNAKIVQSFDIELLKTKLLKYFSENDDSSLKNEPMHVSGHVSFVEITIGQMRHKLSLLPQYNLNPPDYKFNMIFHKSGTLKNR